MGKTIDDFRNSSFITNVVCLHSERIDMMIAVYD